MVIFSTCFKTDQFSEVKKGRKKQGHTRVGRGGAGRGGAFPCGPGSEPACRGIVSPRARTASTQAVF